MSPHVLRFRRGSSVVATLVAAVAWAVSLRRFGWPIQLEWVLLVVAAGLFLRRGVGSQLAARGILLGSVVDGVIEQYSDRSMPLDPWLAAAVLASGAALFLRGGLGLREGADRWRPGAYGGFIALMIVVATGCAYALSFVGWAHLASVGDANRLYNISGGLQLACAAGLSVGAFGLYRLRVWGLVLLLVSAVLVLGFVVTGAFHVLLPRAYALAFVASAEIALLVPVCRRVLLPQLGAR